MGGWDGRNATRTWYNVNSQCGIFRLAAHLADLELAGRLFVLEDGMGRPRNNPKEKQSVHTAFTMTPSQAKKLEAAVKQSGLNRSAYVRQMLKLE